MEVITKALEPSNGEPQSRLQRTPPQVRVSVHYDGELSRPQGLGAVFYEKVRRMRRDPTIKLARWFATAPIVGGSWSVECDTGAPPEAKALVEEQMKYLRHELMQVALYGCYDFGWQAWEKSFTMRDDGLYWCRYLKPLYHDWTYILVMEHTGEYAGIRQNPVHTSFSSSHNPSQTEVFLSTEEAMLVWIDAEGTNWYGEPYSKAAEGPYDDWVTANRVAERFDRKVAGAHWIIYYPIGVTEIDGELTDNAVIAERLAQEMHAIGGVAIPRSVQQAVDMLSAEVAKNEALQWKVELVSAQTNASSAIIDRLKYLDALKVRAYGFPERALLEGTFGTKAEAEAHADLAIMGLEMRHAGLTGLINRDLVNQTVRLNFGHGLDDKVFLKPSPLTDEAKTFLREVYKTMLADPAELYTMDRDAIREKLKIPTLKYVEPEWVDPMAADPYAQPWDPSYGPDPSTAPVTPPVTMSFDPSQPRDEQGRWGSGGGGDRSKGRTRGERLPKNPKKLTIQQATKALEKKGFKLGKPQFDLQSKQTMYELEKDGKTMTVSTDSIKKMLYGTDGK